MNQQQRAVVQQALDALEVVWREHKAITALRQLLEQPEPVQDGWILVPVTPTNDMTSAMADALEDPENERSSWDLAENMWHAMLPKVPTLPAQPAPVQEPVPSSPYNTKRIGWELERTAMGDGYYGIALRAAMDLECVTPHNMTVLQRYAAGVQRSTDHVALQEIAMRVYNSDTTPPEQPAAWVGLTADEMLEALIAIDPATKRLPIGFARFAQAIEAKLKEKNT